MADVELIGVTKRFGAVAVAVDDLSLRIADGEFLILVGPSGCGKTTALRMVAGLEETSGGKVRIGGRDVTNDPPARRDVAMVFQSYALYPHMSVRQNIGFPIRKQKLSKTARETRIREVADALAIGDLLDRKPRELSGGQRQRVAMGRAVIRQPQAFLMDEPLSNLDTKLRVQMRSELVALHRRVGVTTIYVTHDQVEAMTLGDRVAVLSKGVLQQVDTPQRLYEAPSNTFVAGFLGSPAMNFLRGRASDGELEVGPHRVPLPPAFRSAAGEVIVGLRPEHLELDGGDGALAGEVRLAERLGSETLVHIEAEGVSVADELAEQGAELAGTVAAKLDGRVAAGPGERIALSPRWDDLHLFDPATGAALRG